jgi:hypothetical protein
VSTSNAAAGSRNELVGRLRAAQRRLRYHSRPGHGASRTRLPAGEAKALARADVSRLLYMLELAKSVNATAPATGAEQQGTKHED